MSPRSSSLSKTRRITLGVVFACVFIALVGVSVWQLTLLANGSHSNDTTAVQTKTADGSISDTASGSDTEASSSASNSVDSDSQTDDANNEGSQSADSTSAESSSTGASSAQGSQSSGTSGSGSANSGSPSGGSSTPPASQEPPKPATISVSFSIDCVNAVSYGNETALSLSSSGYLLSTQLTLSPGATVYDALMASGAPVNGASSAMGFYVSALYSLQEKACGPTSGWLYLVNGSQPSASCSSYSLSDGDVVQWRYSVNPGDI